MTPYRLINEKELAAFGDALAQNGCAASDFELEEELFDQATAEVEAALGEVGVKNLRTDAVAAYRLGPGCDWVSDFANDLRAGKFGATT